MPENNSHPRVTVVFCFREGASAVLFGYRNLVQSDNPEVVYRTGEVYECPSCEGHCIRLATVEEAERLQAKLKEEIAQNMRLAGKTSK